MCDMLGISSLESVNAKYTLSYFARKYANKDPDGWGVASYNMDNKPCITKRPSKVTDDNEYFDYVSDLERKIIIAHLRHASVGTLNQFNTHPFMKEFFSKYWVFAHNGNVENIPKHKDSFGNTDSEQLFNHLLDYRGTDSSLTSAIERALNEFDRKSSMNIVMSNGKELFAFHHYSQKPMYYTKCKLGIMVSTQLFGYYQWDKMLSDRLYEFESGRLAAIGEKV